MVKDSVKSGAYKFRGSRSSSRSSSAAVECFSLFSQRVREKVERERPQEYIEGQKKKVQVGGFALIGVVGTGIMMCPQPPVSIPLDIDANSTDEEIVLFLGRRGDGDPIPSNVMTEVNPFSIDPRNSPAGIWFLYTSKGSQSHSEGGIIKVTNGYWCSMDDLSISTSTPTVGRKMTREFYAGQAPFGDRTGWRMHEYWAEQVAGQGNNKSKDSSALCRFFLQNDERSDNGEQCDPLPCDADGEDIEALLLSLLEQEERNPSLRDAADGSELVGEDEQRQLESSSRPNQDLVNDNSMVGMEAGYDFSKEDFVELNDLYDPESSSTSSDNSSLMSMNSDECFDAEALLGDIENEDDLNMEECVDYRFSVTSSVRSDQVVIHQPPPDFSNNCNVVVSENGPANSIPAVKPALPSSAVEPQSDSDASASGSSQGSRGSASHPGSSHGGSTSSQRSRSKSVRRMAKLGKRYCCFGGSF